MEHRTVLEYCFKRAIGGVDLLEEFEKLKKTNNSLFTSKSFVLERKWESVSYTSNHRKCLETLSSMTARWRLIASKQIIPTNYYWKTISICIRQS